MENAERFKILFSLRSAARLLELQKRLYSHIDVATRVVSFLAGTAAFASIMKNLPFVTLAIGVVLAVAQAVQLIVRPSEKAAHFARCGKLYSAPLNGAHRLSDDQLSDALAEARDEDDSAEVQALRAIAWNDVAREMGAEKRVRVGLWGHFVGIFA